VTPLRDLAHEEIVDLAVRAEKKQRRRQVWIAIAVVTAIFLMLLWVVWEMNNLLDAQQQEILQNAQQAEQRAVENALILEKIENQLVPRSEFDAINAQLARQHSQLRHQKRQLARQEAQLAAQAAQLDRIEAGVAGSG
jgi:4-amino-4-deoxy-L-arabinose transferase-like glycosyltransferase